MWCAKTMKEDACVQSGILNWTAWASNEAQYGYAAAGPYNMISVALYNKMSDRDFRKLSYKAPEGSVLAGQELGHRCSFRSYSSRLLFVQVSPRS